MEPLSVQRVRLFAKIETNHNHDLFIPNQTLAGLYPFNVRAPVISDIEIHGLIIELKCFLVPAGPRASAD